MDKIEIKSGDILPYTNTAGKICYAKVISTRTISSGKLWFDGIDTVTNAVVFYPVKTSLSLKSYADQEKRKEAIAFAQWTLGPDCEYSATDEDQWTRGPQENITTDQLYDLYLQHLQSLTQHT